MLIRDFQLSDKNAIISLSERFADFKLPPRTEQTTFGKKQMEWMAEDFEKYKDTHHFIIAEENAEVIGFIELAEEEDWMTGGRQAYISRISVAQNKEGKGLGRQLMEAGESWAKEKGYTGIALSVFAENHRGIGLYESLGYQTETCKMRKELS